MHSHHSGLSQRESDVMKAASELFALNGFHATSTRKIADTAQVSEGTLFHYFKTKAHLLHAILDNFYQHKLTAVIEDQFNSVIDTRQRLNLLAKHHAHSLAADNALMLRLIQVYLSSDPAAFSHLKDSHLHDLNRRYTRLFDRVIREGIARSEIAPDIALDAVRDLFFGSIEYGLRTILLRQQPEQLNTYIDLILTPLWQHLLPTNQHSTTEAESTSVPELNDALARLEAVTEKLENLNSDSAVSRS